MKKPTLASNQKELQERRLEFGGDYMAANKPYKFPSNFIKTSKYNVITFLPKSLMLQFQKYANWYFLFTAILQCFPEISTQTPVSAVAPLAFVILLSMLRECMEDIKRHKSDNQMNSSECQVWRGSSWQKIQWAGVRVGDIIFTKEEEIIAADAIILCSSLPTGQAFIETSSLDGEKNLKPRSSISEIQNILFNNLNALQQVQIPNNLIGQISCSMPNPHLHFFEGCIYKDNQPPKDEEGSKNNKNSKKLPANIKNLLLRGSRIKNLEWAIGVVVYTGQDTKIMKNADQGRSKLSNIDKKCNTYIIYVMILQLLLCLLVALLNLKTCRETTNLSIYLASETDCKTQFLYTFAQFLLLLNTMIPISLVVSLEFIKVGQAYYMEKDQELYSVFNQQPLKVFACTMNEELGQIQHIFTDKTGTLTCNKMEFKMLLSGLQTYGDYNILTPNIVQNFERDQHTAQLANRKRMPSYVDHRSGVEYCFNDKILENLIQRPNDNSSVLSLSIKFISAKSENLYELSTEKQLAQELLLLLSTCHECVLQLNKTTGRKSYQGPSPDEIALVDAASRMGYAYSGLDNKEIILNILGKEKRVELLHSIEFDSDRKRMSVIIRDNGKVKMYVKGADSIIKSRLSKSIPQPFLESIDKSLEAFSMKGLRTLCLAMKVLSDEEYEIINNRINSSVGLPNQEKQLKIIGEDIEQELILLGATAVEDRLQDNVPAVLRDFLKANINVWMLTGDKLETAENIGRSCNLITSGMGVLYIRGTNTVDNKIDVILKDYIFELPNLAQEYKDGLAVVVEGESLTWILGDEDRKMQFLRIISECKSVVCCRVTPKQKADVVKLVKEKLKKITLAIGDGANDVNMIQEAHIGVGIYGNEGMRAVQASDYAMGQFQFLWKLVLYHGRLNYIRISECILYFFYKNFVFTFPQLFFSFYSNYSGQSVFDDWYITFYNCIFTFWPVVIKSVYEEDIYYRKKKNLDGTNEKEEKLVMSKIANEDNDIIQKFYPKLYYIGQANRIFQFSRFSKWVMLGIVQGGMCFFLHIYSYSQGIIDDAGDTADIWVMSISLYTAIIILVNLKLALNTQMWTIWNWVAFIFTSFGLYFAYIWISDLWEIFAVYLTADILFNSSKFYFTVILAILICFAFDLLLLTAKNQKESLLNYFKKAARRQHEVELNRVEELQNKLNKELSEMQSVRNSSSSRSSKKSYSSKTTSFDYDSRLKNPSLYTSFTISESSTKTETKDNSETDILEKTNTKENLLKKQQHDHIDYDKLSKPQILQESIGDLSADQKEISKKALLDNEHL